MNHQNVFLFPPFINFCNTIIFFLILETSFAVDFYFQNCSVPKSCGGQNISFPFFISGQQPHYCGFPGFEVSCNEDNGYPSLQLAGNDYLVHNISYQNQTLVVSIPALSNSDTSVCIPLVQNITFPTDQYDLVPNQRQLLLLYDCNSSLVDESFSEYRIGCYDGYDPYEPNSKTANTSVLALPQGNDQLFDDVPDKCKSKVVATAFVEESASNFGNELGVAAALRRGFMLKWLASNCSQCEGSGGKCGFDLKLFLRILGQPGRSMNTHNTAFIVVHHAGRGHGYVQLEFTIGRPQCLG